MDTPPEPNSFDLAQGRNQGFTIGGGGTGGSGGGGGDGGGCDPLYAKSYPPLINSQLRTVFTRNEKTDKRIFRIKAQLWFDPTGHVQRAQLVGSTGDIALDKDIPRLLNDINIGERVPACIQPATVWVSQFWEARSTTPAHRKPTQRSRAAGRPDMADAIPPVDELEQGIALRYLAVSRRRRAKSESGQYATSVWPSGEGLGDKKRHEDLRSLRLARPFPE